MALGSIIPTIIAAHIASISPQSSGDQAASRAAAMADMPSMPPEAPAVFPMSAAIGTRYPQASAVTPKSPARM